MLQHVLGLLVHPQRQWRYLNDINCDSLAESLVGYLLILATIGPLSLLVGLTLFGWQSLDGSLVTVGFKAAIPLALAFYLMILASVVLIAFAMYRIENYFNGAVEFEPCLVFASYTAVPLLLSGIVGLIPVVWFNVLVVCIAAVFSTRLLITGMPVFLYEASQRKSLLVGIILFTGFSVLAMNSIVFSYLLQTS